MKQIIDLPLVVNTVLTGRMTHRYHLGQIFSKKS